MKRPAMLVALILAVGIAGAVVALTSRGANPQFIAEQQHLMPVRATALARLIETTSDPRPGYRGRARSARCASGAHGGALGNPWTCTVRYPRPPAVRYVVTVRADGSIHGSGQQLGVHLLGTLTIRGCCVSLTR